ncbi:MAG: aminopeptidase P family N-terminal domain-containing protein, partial [Sporomusaceae bacterium]|nr:aminopeptidase P family N-terminal domain-containing protein [Sporomusaceae bacterium]
MVPKNELEKRVELLQNILREKEIDGALLVYPADTLYFTGTAQNVHLYISQEGAPLILAHKDADRAARECPFPVTPLAGISKLPQQIADAKLNYRGPKLQETLDAETRELKKYNAEQQQSFEKMVNALHFIKTGTLENAISTPPTQEQLALLSALQFRSNVT